MNERSDNQPWLVTGSAGFLGTHVVELLLARGRRVIAVDTLAWGRRAHPSAALAHPNFEAAEVDIRDAATLRDGCRRLRPAAVVHLAALHYIPDAEADPPRAIAINVAGTQAVLSAALEADVARIFVASTGDVYAPSDAPHAETDALAPFNIYGLSKMQDEPLTALAARRYPDASLTVGRLFNLYGPRETNPHILPEIFRQLRARPEGPLRLGNTWPRRDLVPVADAARAVVELLETSTPGLETVNIATGAARSVDEIIATIGALLGRDFEVEVDPERVRPVERGSLRADVSRLRTRLGWTPGDDLKAGLKALLDAEPHLLFVE